MDLSAAEQSMGEAVVASAPLIPSGYAWRVGVRASGSVSGNIVGAAEAAERMRTDTAPGAHEGDLVITVSASRVAIWEMKRGLLKKSLGQRLEQFERRELKSIEWTRGKIGASTLTLELTDGVRFELQAARVNRGKAERVVEALQAPARGAGG